MLIRASTFIDPAFLEMVLDSPLITQLAPRQKTTGGAAPRVNVATVKAYPIPVPPLTEQRRILAKVDELMRRVRPAESTAHQHPNGKPPVPRSRAPRGTQRQSSARFVMIAYRPGGLEMKYCTQPSISALASRLLVSGYLSWRTPYAYATATTSSGDAASSWAPSCTR